MSGREDGGGSSAPEGATPASIDSTSWASADATLEEEPLRDVQKEVEEKTGAMHCAQGTSSSAPTSPSKVLRVGKNSAPSLPVPAAPQERNTVSDVAGTSESVPGVAVTDDASSGQKRVAHTRSESAAAGAQGEAALAEMEQAMPALRDPSHRKMESTNLPGDFASKSPSSDIKSLRDGYLYKLMEIDRRYTVPNLTEEQLQSSDKTEDFNNREESIREALKFLQVEKIPVSDGLMEKLQKYKALILSLMSVLEEPEVLDVKMNTVPYSGGKRSHESQTQPADAIPSFPINSPEDLVQREGAETLVGKSPLDRLRDAVRSSLPEAFLGSVCSMSSVFRESSNGVSFEVRTSDSESSRVRSPKRQKMQNASYDLRGEIKSINKTLVGTEITIAGDSGTSSGAGTTIKLSYTAVALSPELSSLFASSEEYDIMPAKLSVPSDYPTRSPMLITDEGDDELRKKSSALSDSVHTAFSLALENLPESHSIKDIANAWNTCVRTAVTKFAQQHGGGTFSSRFGSWQKCVGS